MIWERKDKDMRKKWKAFSLQAAWRWIGGCGEKGKGLRPSKFTGMQMVPFY